MTEAPVARIEPPDFLARPAVAAVLAALPGARAVGGCVRDALAGRDFADVDVAAPLPPEEIARRLRVAGLRVFDTGLSHGTVTAVLAREAVEVTALRRDVLTDGRHAVVAWTTDWREDAARRDFTINAMSLTHDGALFDHFGGREDLAAGRVRFVGDPDVRLAEDYLRALRFFRFQARYGRGAPDGAAVAAIARAVPGLGRLSAERVWMELKRILSVPDPVAAVALMAETGVLPAVLPESVARDGFVPLRRLVAAGAPADPLLRLAALLPGPAPGLAARLKLSGEEAAALSRLLRAAPADPALQGASLRVALAEAESASAEDAQRAAWLAEARDGRDRAALRARIAAADWPRFPVQGRDVLALGLPPGPGVGRLLAALRAWWLAGGCVATREEVLAEAARRIGGGSGGTALGG